jgi:hypothetical protein
MSEGLGIALITIGGVASMGAIAFVFIRIMINTTNYSNKKNNGLKNS